MLSTRSPAQAPKALCDPLIGFLRLVTVDCRGGASGFLKKVVNSFRCLLTHTVIPLTSIVHLKRATGNVATLRCTSRSLRLSRTFREARAGHRGSDDATLRQGRLKGRRKATLVPGDAFLGRAEHEQLLFFQIFWERCQRVALGYAGRGPFGGLGVSHEEIREQVRYLSAQPATLSRRPRICRKFRRFDLNSLCSVHELWAVPGAISSNLGRPSRIKKEIFQNMDLFLFLGAGINVPHSGIRNIYANQTWF